MSESVEETKPVPARSNGGGRGRMARYGVPVAVLTVAVASIGLVPALADNGDPDLPSISAEELVAKIAESEVEHFSGTVETRTDLGLPGSSLQGLLPEAGPSAGGRAGADADAEPASRLAGLFSGTHTVKLAVDGEERQRAAISGDGVGDYTFVHNDGTVWGYDKAAGVAYRAEAPEGAKGTERPGPGADAVNPQQAAKELLAAVEDTTTVKVDGTTKVAGRNAYVLAAAPKGAPDSTIDALRIAVDADNGVPLKVTLDARGGGKPIGEVAFTEVDFGKPAASTFDFAPPKGTKIVEGEGEEWEQDGKDAEKGEVPEGLLEGLPGLEGLLEPGAAGADGDVRVVGEGWNSVLAVRAPEGAGTDAALPDSGRAGKVVDAFTDKAKGDFGTGRVVSTRLVNALLTDDGSVYVGAVTKEGLIKVANADAR